MRKTVALFTQDSYILPSVLFARKTIEAGDICEKIYLQDKAEDPDICINKAEIKDFSVVSKEDLPDYIRRNKIERIFLGAGGGLAEKLIAALKTHAPETEIIAYFSGICGFRREKAFISRRGADQILFNTPEDAAVYHSLGAIYDFPTDNAVIFGHPQLMGAPLTPAAPVAFDSVRRIVFFDQNIIPASFDERVFLTMKLAELKRLYPDKEVIVKLRCRPQEKTPHPLQKRYCLEYIAKEELGLSVLETPKFSFEVKTSDLTPGDLVLSLSSTALIEAMYRGIPALAVADFLNFDCYSIDYYRTSGRLSLFKDIPRRCAGPLNPDWAAAKLIEAGGNDRPAFNRPAPPAPLTFFKPPLKNRKTVLGAINRFFKKSIFS